MLNADNLIRLLALQPHPEGGHYRETFRDPVTVANGRAASTAMYYLLRAGERAHWHRIDATEVWHYYAGAALRLFVCTSTAVDQFTLGADLAAGERSHVIVPNGAWQAAESTGTWTLAGCTVAPAFAFEGLEIAPPGWSPTS
jgi:predicted cupin superfamily sugar epimerase